MPGFGDSQHQHRSLGRNRPRREAGSGTRTRTRCRWRCRRFPPGSIIRSRIVRFGRRGAEPTENLGALLALGGGLVGQRQRRRRTTTRVRVGRSGERVRNKAIFREHHKATRSGIGNRIRNRIRIGNRIRIRIRVGHHVRRKRSAPIQDFEGILGKWNPAGTCHGGLRGSLLLLLLLPARGEDPLVAVLLGLGSLSVGVRIGIGICICICIRIVDVVVIVGIRGIRCRL
mmetsp:Transcript_8530/g.25272  ORF Transcript_8530/g.25272 Transcript_8530/m.25272 type:complete len:229 (+) Transcript_8530:450-1136(+)